MTDHRGQMKRVVLVFGALVAAVWYFILRVGPRRELPEGATPVTAEGAIDHARRVAAVDQVGHADLVGTWAPTTATDVEVLVEGNTFYPRMLEDIASATGSIHVMQYGFQPGVVGDPFARAFAAKAREGVKVRLILDAPRQPRVHELEADARGPRRRRRRGHAPRPDPPGSPWPDRPAAGDAARLAGRARRAPQARPRRRPRGVHRRRGHRGPLRQRQVPRRLHPRHRADHPSAPGPLRDDLPLSRRDDRGRRPVAHRTTPPPSSPAATTSRCT